jgi:hypothetical protein
VGTARVPEGWLIIWHGWEGYRGAAAQVIERSGQVMRFPSGVAPRLIVQDYARTRDSGHPDYRWPALPVFTREEAARRAGEVLRVPAADPEHPWELIEFPRGWFVQQYGWEGYRGRGPIVIDNATGQVFYFFSAIGPESITEDYYRVRAEFASPDERWPAPAPPAASPR